MDAFRQHEAEKRAHEITRQKLLLGGGNGSPPPSPPLRVTRHMSPSQYSKGNRKQPSPPPRYQQRQMSPPMNSQQHPQFTTHGFGVDYDLLDKDPQFHKYMDQYIQINKDKYFMDLIKKGVQVPYDFDVNKNIKRQNPSFQEQIGKNMKMLMDKITPKNPFSLQSVCPLPFEKSILEVEFPKKIEFPHYDKYNGNGDPSDHVRQFNVLSLEFSHKDAYLMRLFHGSLKGQAMEWFTKITPPRKNFEELVQKFIQHFSYNLQKPVFALDLCNLKQDQGEPFVTFLQR